MRSLLAVTWAFAASASSFLPAFMSWPISLDLALRSACSCSTSTMMERRCSSSSKNFSRSQCAFWRSAQDLSTTSGFSRTNLISSMLVYPLCNLYATRNRSSTPEYILVGTDFANRMVFT